MGEGGGDGSVGKGRARLHYTTLVLAFVNSIATSIGFSSLLRRQGKPQEDAVPTIGFDNSEFTFEDYQITLYDLGGGKKIRNVWK